MDEVAFKVLMEVIRCAGNHRIGDGDFACRRDLSIKFYGRVSDLRMDVALRGLLADGLVVRHEHGKGNKVLLCPVLPKAFDFLADFERERHENRLHSLRVMREALK